MSTSDSHRKILFVTSSPDGTAALARRAARCWPPHLHHEIAEDHQTIGPDCSLTILLGHSRIVPQQALARCGGPVVVVHSSDLPRGRGWAPIYTAIASGYDEHVITLCHAAPQPDTGNILVKARMPIRPNYTAGMLRSLGREVITWLVGHYAPLLAQDNPPGMPQSGPATTVPRRRPQDNAIDPARPVEELMPHLMACEDGHPAFFTHGGETFTIRVEPVNQSVDRRIRVEEYLYGESGPTHEVNLETELQA